MLDVGEEENYSVNTEACNQVTAVLKLLQEMSKTQSLRQKTLISLKQQVCCLVVHKCWNTDC
jgi:hypothetical protein